MKKTRKLFPKRKEHEIADGIKGPFFTRYDSFEAADSAVRDFENRKETKRDEFDEDEQQNRDTISEDNESFSEDRIAENLLNEKGEEMVEFEEEGTVSTEEAGRILEQMRRNEAEDDEFERAFRAVMQDSIENAGKQSGVSSKTVDVNMARPAVLPKPKNVFSRFSETDDDDAEIPQRGVTFKLLSRDNKGKIETRQLLIPEENQIALRLAKAEASRIEARLRLKQQVLNLDSKLEDEESDEGDTRKAPLFSVASKDRNIVAKNSFVTGQPTEARDLNLSDFLAESNAADMRRFKSNFSDQGTSIRGLNSQMKWGR